MASLPEDVDQAMQDRLATSLMEVSESLRDFQEQAEGWRLLIDAEYGEPSADES